MKRRMFRFSSIGFLLVAGLIFAMPSAMQAQESILTQISRNNQIETEMSKMALKKSQNADVKKFAKQVIKENSGIAGQVFSASLTYHSNIQVDVPKATDAAMKKMKAATGKDFDEQYLVQMDAFTKDDKAAAASATDQGGKGGMSDVSEIGDQLLEIANKRAQKIPQLTQAVGFKIQ